MADDSGCAWEENADGAGRERGEALPSRHSIRDGDEAMGRFLVMLFPSDEDGDEAMGRLLVMLFTLDEYGISMRQSLRSSRRMVSSRLVPFDHGHGTGRWRGRILTWSLTEREGDHS